AQVVPLIANAYADGGIPPDSDAAVNQTFRAVGIDRRANAEVWRQDGPLSAQIAAPGRIVNKGLIDAERGVVILNGDDILNGTTTAGVGGIIRANTSITRNGEIFLDARLQLTLAPSSSIQTLPAENGESIPRSAMENFAPASIEMQGTPVDFE